MKRTFRFPKNFLWGAATSAYQVEGGNDFCDWSDYFPAGLACDHYHRFKDDFSMIKKMGHNAHRLSIEWSRIEPKKGEFNKQEIEHYRTVLKELKKNEIKNFLTLFHFTLPKWVAQRGGFLNKENIFHFCNFCSRIFKEYKDLVDYWVVLNEPDVYASLGYVVKRWPPRKRNFFQYLRVRKNLLKSYKAVYREFHSKQKDVLIGIAHNKSFLKPYCQKSFFDRFSVKLAKWWQDYFLEKIKNEVDFIGLNYYFSFDVKFPIQIKNTAKNVSDLGWPINPEGIYFVLKDLAKYKKPIFITENGLADKKDKLRKDFIKNHLFWIWGAIKEGVDARGYLHWSLMDNFEWDLGFEPRFGLAEIDYKTLKRKPRRSAIFYSQICKKNHLIFQ